jgi:diguanylate cyclase (GGDEF)-like protein
VDPDQPREETPDPRTWYVPHRAIICLGVILTLVAVAGGTLGVKNADRAAAATSVISNRYLPLQPPVREVRASIAAFQVLVEQTLAESTPPSDSFVTSAVQVTNVTDQEFLTLQRLLAQPANVGLAPHLDQKMAAYVSARGGLAAFVTSTTHTAEAAKEAATERAADVSIDAALGSLQAVITSRLVHTADAAQSAVQRVRTDLMLCLGIGVLFAIAATAVLARKALRVERQSSRQETVQARLSRRIEFESRLQSALEMARDEPHVFDRVTEALGSAAPDMRSELLLADSSRAHFRQVLVSPANSAESGCGVVSPDDCPAAVRGQTMTFARSTAIDACPNLRGRECSATCVPVSISGNSVGVFHVISADGTPPSGEVRRDVEVVARRASERLAMLRAFAQSQTQANSDSLTGLLTRRSLESSVRGMQDSGASYTVAYGDLDHFKQLNDVFGHDAGDRALRTFSQVLRDSLRPSDFPSRYGGEEFVIVLPGCPVREAVEVLERVRTGLAHRLAAGNLPTFTVSFGVAGSDQAVDFEQLVKQADDALMQAKAGGRDQIVISGGTRSVPSSPRAVADVVRPPDPGLPALAGRRVD